MTALRALAAEDVPQGNRFQRAWSSERVVEAVQSWARLYGQPPTSEEWEVGKPEKRAQAALDKARLWNEKATRFADGCYRADPAGGGLAP